ncbi:MAG: SpoIIE family protein phosphatase [bacterium]|nr:SpoIIE family protein phosphatase [bacterium]
MTEGNADIQSRLSLLEEENAHLRRIQACTAALISSLQLDETLQAILHTAMDVADAGQGSILLYDTERAFLRIAEAIGLSPETIAATRVRPGEGISGRVAVSGEPILVEDIDNDPRFEEKRQSARRSRSFASLPLAYREKILGVLNLSAPRKETCFKSSLLPHLTTLGHQAAVAITHAELHGSMLEKERLDQQIEMARAIQESFVPPGFSVSGDGFGIAGRNLSASAVGGDFIGTLDAGEGRHLFFLGDVSGKGIAAALYMARLISDIQHVTRSESDPARLLAALNSHLCQRRLRGMFVTMLIGLTMPGSGRIRLASAGHLPPLLRETGGGVRTLAFDAGPPLGIAPDYQDKSFELEMKEGEVLLAYTDGAWEAESAKGEDFGSAGLEESLKSTKGGAAKVLDGIFDRLEAFCGTLTFRDDVTLLAVERK